MAWAGREFGSPDYERLIAEEVVRYPADDGSFNAEDRRDGVHSRRSQSPCCPRVSPSGSEHFSSLMNWYGKRKHRLKTSTVIDDALSFVVESNQSMDEMRPPVPIGKIKTIGNPEPKYEVGQLRSSCWKQRLPDGESLW